MSLPSEILEALKNYDTKKGKWRRLFRIDQAAIRALRKLSENDHANFLKIYQCFIKNKPKPTQESYKVYLALLDYLSNIDYSGIPETLNQLHHNKLLNEANLNQLSELKGKQFTQLSLLFPPLNTRGLLIQDNFDKFAKYFKIVTEDKLDDELSSIVNAINLLGNRYLTQKNLDWLLEKPLEAGNRVRALRVLGENSLITSNNRAELSKENNQFLLSDQAYFAVWNPLENYLPKIVDTQEKQLIFDKLTLLTQEEDSQQKIGQYITKLIPEAMKRPRRNTYDRYATAPPLRSKSRDSLNDLVMLTPERMGTL